MVSCRLLVAIVLSTLPAVGCGGTVSAPAGLNDGSDLRNGSNACRPIPTSARYTFTTPETSVSANVRCAFDRATATLTCTPSAPTATCRGPYVARYQSVGDFVDEANAFGTIRAISQTGLGLGDVCSDSTSVVTTYAYDGQGRLRSAAAPSVTGGAVYSNYDAMGRPTAYTQTGGGCLNARIAYDDGARTVHISGTSPVNCGLVVGLSSTQRFSSNLIDRTEDTTVTLNFGGGAIPIPLHTSFVAESTTDVCK